MKLFNVHNDNLEEIESIPFQLEKDIQQVIEKNVSTIFGLSFIQSELSIDKYRIDTLCYDEVNNSFVIIEYKKGSSYSVIDQGFTYYQLMLNNKSDFILLLSHHLGKLLKVEDIDWGQSRIIFISPTFNSYQKDSVNFKNLPFELWEVKRYSNNSIVLNQHISNSKEEIKSLGDSSSDVISEVSKGLKSITDEEHYKKTGKNVLSVYLSLKESLIEFGDIELIPKGQYISLMTNGTTICYFNFLKSYIRLDILRGNENPDGSRSKKFFYLDDPKQLSKEGNWSWKTGVKGHYYSIPLDEKSDVNYILFLIKQKYNQLKG
jgi:hypothetical protein